MRPQLTVIHGAGAVVSALEETLARVRTGEIEAVALVTFDTEGDILLNIAHSEAFETPWAKLVAGAAVLQYELLENGL